MNKIKDVAQRLGIITVEDMERYTALELIVMIANKMNDYSNELHDLSDKVQYLLNEGTLAEVIQIFDEWIQDGTFDTLINQSALKEVNDRVDETNAQLSEMQQRVDGWINVRELGAKLDGVADETDILVRAHDLLPESGGKIIIPSGKLVISSLVEFTKTVILEGMAVNQLSKDKGSVIVTTNTGELKFRGSCSGVVNLMVYGEVGNIGNGITLECDRPWAENVTCLNQGDYGMVVGGERTTQNVNGFYLANIRSRANGKGGLFIGNALNIPANCNAGSLTKIDCSQNLGDGIILQNAHDNNFLSVHIEANQGNGVKFFQSTSNLFVKPYIEANVGGDWYGDAQSELNYIEHTRNQADYNHGYNFENDNNYYSYNYLTKGMKDWKNRIGVDKLIVGGRSQYGFWEFQQDSANKLLSLKNTDTTQSQRFKVSHNNSNSKVILDVQGLAMNDSKDAITDIKFNSGTRNFGVVNANSTKDITINMAGVGDVGFCIVNTSSLPDGVFANAWVSAIDTVTLRISNCSTMASPAINQVFQILVLKREYLNF